jgi:hypothetical protein
MIDVLSHALIGIETNLITHYPISLFMFIMNIDTKITASENLKFKNSLKNYFFTKYNIYSRVVFGKPGIVMIKMTIRARKTYSLQLYEVTVRKRNVSYYRQSITSSLLE